MRLRAVIWLLFPLFAYAEIAHGTQKISTPRCSGEWAAAAVSPYDHSKDFFADTVVWDFKADEVASPSAEFSIKASPEGLTLISSTGQTLLPLVYSLPLVEVLWSADSRYFAINFSDGGAVGTWSFALYSVADSQVPKLVDIGKVITKRANALPKCSQHEDANLGVASWLKGAKELLIIAEAPGHSSCRNMGELAAYRVSVETGKILESMSASTLKENWASVLGCRLKHQEGRVQSRQNQVK